MVRLLLCLVGWSLLTSGLHAQTSTVHTLETGARSLIASARYGTLVTIGSDGAPEARTIENLPPDPDFTIWFATNSRTRKVAAIARDPHVALHWFDHHRVGYVVLHGLARIEMDPVERARRWQPGWSAHYPDPARDYVLVRVTPTRMEVVSPADGIIGDSLTWRPPTVTFARQDTLPASGSEARLLRQLAEAQRELAADPSSVDALIWVGRRTAYLGRYGDAIAIYAEGIARHPTDARLYRHRGHRYISTRQFDRAIADLRYAAMLTRGQPDQVEPDGMPNARNIPVSTLQSNIWYHLALAHYLKGEFREAAAAWQHDVDRAANPDTEAASRYWLWLTRKRLGDDRGAARALRPVTPQMEIIENGSYHRLLLLFKGVLPASALLDAADPDPALQDATIRYGVGAWHWVSGRREEALTTWRSVVATGLSASFGYLAAEADLARFEPP